MKTATIVLLHTNVTIKKGEGARRKPLICRKSL